MGLDGKDFDPFITPVEVAVKAAESLAVEGYRLSTTSIKTVIEAKCSCGETVVATASGGPKEARSRLGINFKAHVRRAHATAGGTSDPTAD